MGLIDADKQIVLLTTHNRTLSTIPNGSQICLIYNAMVDGDDDEFLG